MFYLSQWFIKNNFFAPWDQTEYVDIVVVSQVDDLFLAMKNVITIYFEKILNEIKLSGGSLKI